MDDRKPFGYLYRTTIFTGRKLLVYVGKREKPRFTKSYVGSGAIIRKILADGDYQTINVELVGYFYTKEELYSGEIALIEQSREDWLGNCLNIANGGDGGRRRTWTRERCISDARRFSTRVEWGKSSPAGYSAACKHGYLEDCCAHMVRLDRPDGYWTYERCKEDGLNYASRGAWIKSGSTAYRIARISGWLDQCCSHMKPLRKPDGYWTLERCQQDALRFSRKKDWKKNSSGAFSRAHDNGWLELCCAHMRRPISIDTKQAA